MSASNRRGKNQDPVIPSTGVIFAVIALIVGVIPIYFSPAGLFPALAYAYVLLVSFWALFAWQWQAKNAKKDRTGASNSRLDDPGGWRRLWRNPYAWATAVSSLLLAPIVFFWPSNGPAYHVVVNTAESLFSAPKYHKLDEYVCIANIGTASANLLGWTLSDAEGEVYTFPQYELRPGHFVRVYTKKGARNDARLYIGDKQPIWTDTGDTVTIRNSNGGIEDRRTYAARAAGAVQGKCGSG